MDVFDVFLALFCMCCIFLSIVGLKREFKMLSNFYWDANGELQFKNDDQSRTPPIRRSLCEIMVFAEILLLAFASAGIVMIFSTHIKALV